MPTPAQQRIAREMTNDQGWMWSVSFEVADRVHRELPAFRSRPELRDATTAGGADIVDLFLAMLAEDIPEHRVEPGSKARGYVRMLVERRISAEDLAAAYRIGVRTFWARWTEVLQARAAPDDYAAALTASTRYILAWADALTERVTAMHAEERALWSRDPEAVRHDTLRAILDGRPIERDLAEQRLRYALDRPHRCLVVWSTTAAIDLRPESLRDTVPSLFAGQPDPAIVTLPLGPSIAIWWSPADPRALVVPGEVEPAVRAALGPVQDGIAGFRASYLDAMNARRVAVLEEAAVGSVTEHASVAVRALASADLEQANRFVGAALGELADPDPNIRELATTLRAFLDHGSNLRATASALRVHHNTVANRIRRAEQLLPSPTVGHSADILVALELLTIADHTSGTQPREVGAQSSLVPAPGGAALLAELERDR